MSDYMVRGTAAAGQLRFFGAYTRDTAEFGRQAHNLSPVAAAALGRLLTGGAMLGYMMKNEEDRLTIKIDCDGPIGGLMVTADSQGHVKGYVKNPDVDLPPTPLGKLDVGGALGLGVLSVIRDEGLKEPYVGQTILETGEIGDDLTYYFMNSEQIPSSVALGVLFDKETGAIKEAGGFIIQLMPNASDTLIRALEERITMITSITSWLASGNSIEEMLMGFFEGMVPVINERIPVSFTCDCSAEHTAGVLQSLPREELQEMIDDGEPVEVCCQFCGKRYIFQIPEVQAILNGKE